jgi:hypothetical protein
MTIEPMLLIQSDLLNALHLTVVDDLINADDARKGKHSFVNFGLPCGGCENDPEYNININDI